MNFVRSYVCQEQSSPFDRSHLWAKDFERFPHVLGFLVGQRIEGILLRRVSYMFGGLHVDQDAEVDDLKKLPC